MRYSALARRYAEALFRVASRADIVDNVESDLGLISYSLENTPSMRDALAHPLIHTERKKKIVEELFRGSVQDITMDFLRLLIEKRREGIMEYVEAEYVRIADEARNTVLILVTSAVPLSADQQDALRAKLREFTGKNVELDIEEDKRLIGGIRIRIDDVVIDGSISGLLQSMRDRLLERD